MFANIELESARVKSFSNVFRYNKTTRNEGAMHYAIYFLSINDEMCEVDKYMKLISKEHPDYKILEKMKMVATSYFKISEIHNGYITVMDLNTNTKYDVYDINIAACGEGNIGRIIYSTILEIDDIKFFAGYSVLLTDVTEDNYKEEVERHKKRIKLTTNSRLVELVATLQLSKDKALYVTV